LPAIKLTQSYTNVGQCCIFKRFWDKFFYYQLFICQLNIYIYITKIVSSHLAYLILLPILGEARGSEKGDRGPPPPGQEGPVFLR